MLANPANFYERTRAARKVIVVDLGFLGDTVHLVPALWELKRNYPAAALHVLTSWVGAQVLELAPCVETRVGHRAGPREAHAPPAVADTARAAPRTLRRCVQLQWCRPHRLYDRAHRRALAGGTSGARWHFWNPWLVPTWVARQNPDLIVFEQRRQVLAACGLKLGAPRWDLALSETVRRWSESLVRMPAVHFSINASSPLKEWPVESWVELARRLLAEDPDLQIVATSSANAREQARLKAFVAGAGSQRLVALSPGLPIAKLAAVLQRCQLHVAEIPACAPCRCDGSFSPSRCFGSMATPAPGCPRARPIRSCACPASVSISDSSRVRLRVGRSAWRASNQRE